MVPSGYSPEFGALASGLVFGQRFAELQELLDIGGPEPAILADLQRWEYWHTLSGRMAVYPVLIHPEP
jgi:hypothetical protein